MASTSPSSGPRIEQNLAVTAYQLYNIYVEIMLTDLDHSTEYTDIYLNTNHVGRCNPTLCQGCCDWYGCTISPSQVFSTNSVVNVTLQYSTQVNAFAQCSYDGQTGHAVALVTISSAGDTNNIY